MNLNLVFSKSMNLNLVFLKSMNLNSKLKKNMNGFNPTFEVARAHFCIRAYCTEKNVPLVIISNGTLCKLVVVSQQHHRVNRMELIKAVFKVLPYRDRTYFIQTLNKKVRSSFTVKKLHNTSGATMTLPIYCSLNLNIFLLSSVYCFNSLAYLGKQFLLLSQ